MGQKACRYRTEAGGLEPPRVISPPHFECGALPIRLRLRGHSPIPHAKCSKLIGAPGFEPGTSATRTQRSTGLSHAPNRPALWIGPALGQADGVGFEPTRACTHTISNRAP